ncbi:hypothetical protein DVA67_012800 [Solirubrobacter sp. CPCC 204708]|uniref:Uncharacterized protein n=1 Tax=Solirubrobacter deserti TaxID=2282478 RepID=A0ABT4RK48_9ACTN|nr:hypothetical protein [Solirubrobacter deserti]MBE2316854.1 hypothetical protein [Solirubrobacter deserti]MDA0138929.1 hypothetical protein [Solirubrobacter deserti]
MKFAIALAAAAIAVVFAIRADAVEEAPDAALQLVEIEQQTPYLESYNSTIAVGNTTQSIIRRQGNSGGVVFSSQAYAQFENHNADGSRATFPVEVEEGALYGISIQFVKAPTHGIVQVAVDGRPLGQPVDLYAPALQRAEPVNVGTLALAEGKHTFTFTVTAKNEAATNYFAGIDLVILDTQAAVQPTPTAVATAEVGGEVPPTLSLTLDGTVGFDAFQPGVAREYTASTDAKVTSTAGDAMLSIADTGANPGHLVNGAYSLQQPLHARAGNSGDFFPLRAAPLRLYAYSAPVSGHSVPLQFRQAIGGNEPLRTGRYAKTLTFTLTTTNP